MKALVVRVVLMSLFSLPAAAIASSAAPTGVMEVSFVVQEACVVQATDASPSVGPEVSCEYDSPYTVQHTRQQGAVTRSGDQQQAATSAAQSASAEGWTVYF
jgi:hypothetical protein